MKVNEKKRIAGEKGENLVEKILIEGIANIQILKNVNYAFESSIQDSSHQIDFILINNKNLYIIEVKSYRKMLIYDYNQENWVIEYHKTGNKDRKRNGIDNPLVQNHNHREELIKHLSSIKKENIIALSTIVSNGDYLYGEKWKEIKPNEFLCKPEALVELIGSLEIGCIEYTDKEKIYQEIINLPYSNNAKHIKYITRVNEIKKIAKKNDINLSNLRFTEKKCPKCNSKMYLRTWGDSLFWGCEDYPCCTQTIRIS